MNPVIETILRRQSVRDGYLDLPIPHQVLEEIVRCGLAAPSSKNAHPWGFHVVSDRLLLHDLAVLVETSEGIDDYVPSDPATGMPGSEWKSTVLESAAILKAVSAAIFLENSGAFTGGRAAMLAAAPEAMARSIVGFSFEAMGVGAALENMWLAAVSQGLSGVFMGDVLIAERQICQRLAIRGDLAGVLALGFVDEHTSPRVRLSPALDGELVKWFPRE